MTPPQSIELYIRIAAPREVVFRFFSDPRRYKLWMGENSTMNPGPNGQLTVSFGPGPTALGRIIEWCEPERITFEWSHEGRPGVSKVIITLTADGTATLVTLRHEGIVEVLERDGTASGWRYYLSALSNATLAERLNDVAPATIERYFSAWSKIDPERRLDVLADTVAEGVKFRDRYGAVDGRRCLSDYIGGLLSRMGPARIEPEGPLDRVHAFARQNWVIRQTDDRPPIHGQNFYEWNDQLQICAIISFWA